MGRIKLGPFKSQPLGNHQLEDLERSAELDSFGLFWEMGLGKTWELLNTAAHLHRHYHLTGLLVIAPNGVHENLLGEEAHLHIPDDIRWRGCTYDTGRSATRKHQALLDPVVTANKDLNILSMSYDSIRTERGLATAQGFLKTHACLLALDESTAIKTPSAKISKRCANLGKLAPWRRIMDGTPLAESPFDIYYQLKFLEPSYWARHGMSSFWVFKQTFGIFQPQRARQGHSYNMQLGYQNLERLQKMIADISSRRLKEDCLDLPPNMYKRATFKLAPRQQELYNEMRRATVAEFTDGRVIEATTALSRLMRLQQITCGYAATVEAPPVEVEDAPTSPEEAERRRQEVLRWYESPLPGTAVQPGAVVTAFTTGPHDVTITAEEMKSLSAHMGWEQKARLEDVIPPEENPRLQLLLGLIDRTHHKSIVFCRFTRDVVLITHALGTKAARYDGHVKGDDRQLALRRFREDETCRVLVCNIAALSRGVTLTQAKTVFYYSNTFSLIHRLQSEDRAHRIGQTEKVLYVDLVAQGTVDEHIVKTLRQKYDVAALCHGDNLRAWLTEN